MKRSVSPAGRQTPIEVLAQPNDNSGHDLDHSAHPADHQPIHSVTSHTQSRFESVSKKLNEGKPLRIVMLNDAGFNGGAGVATGRQAISLMAGGHKIAMVCSFRNTPPRLRTRGRDLSEHWLGITELTKYNGWFGPIRDHDQTVNAVVDAVRAYTPDLVIVGNFHGGKWPFEIIKAIHDESIPTIVYTHDFHHITGGCVYPMDCTLHQSQCDSSCPSANDYPQIDRSQIADAHNLRRECMTGNDPIPVAGNSQWVCDLTRKTLGSEACLGLLPLPIDTDLFSPIDKAVARRMLKIPGQAFVGVFGAVDMGNDHRKGLAFLPEVCQALQRSGKCHLISFGKHSEQLKHVRGFGMIGDHRVMPLLYSAADIQMSFSAWETFGQTALEGASCQRPVVVRDSGGITQIAHDEINGIVVRPDTPEAFVESVLGLVEDKERREAMGNKGRELAIEHHSMDASRATIEQWLIAMGSGATGSGSFGIAHQNANTFRRQLHQINIGGQR